MVPRPPRFNRTDPLFPSTKLFRSNPGAERTAAVEGGEALPQRDLQFLFEIAPQVRIGLITARETGERAAETADRFRKKPILIPVGHAGLPSFVSHALLVGGATTF